MMKCTGKESKRAACERGLGTFFFHGLDEQETGQTGFSTDSPDNQGFPDKQESAMEPTSPEPISLFDFVLMFLIVFVGCAAIREAVTCCLAWHGAVPFAKPFNATGRRTCAPPGLAAAPILPIFVGPAQTLPSAPSQLAHKPCCRQLDRHPLAPRSRLSICPVHHILRSLDHPGRPGRRFRRPGTPRIRTCSPRGADARRTASGALVLVLVAGRSPRLVRSRVCGLRGSCLDECRRDGVFQHEDKALA